MIARAFGSKMESDGLMSPTAHLDFVNRNQIMHLLTDMLTSSKIKFSGDFMIWRLPLETADSFYCSRITSR